MAEIGVIRTEESVQRERTCIIGSEIAAAAPLPGKTGSTPARLDPPCIRAPRAESATARPRSAVGGPPLAGRERHRGRGSRAERRSAH